MYVVFVFPYARLSLIITPDHCQMMRYMGMGNDSVIIIHMGGVYGDKEGALARFKENYTTKLTDEMKARLVLENDEVKSISHCILAIVY